VIVAATAVAVVVVGLWLFYALVVYLEL